MPDSISRNKKTNADKTATNKKAANKTVNLAEIFSRVMELSHDAIIGLTEDFRIAFWSKGAENKFGYTKSEIIDKSAEILFPEDRLSELKYEVEKVSAGCVLEGCETVRLHKSGKPIDVSISIAPLYCPNRTFNGAIAIYEDVSEKKELSNKLREYEKKCRDALEGGQFGIWDLDILNKKILHFNNFENTLGYEDMDDRLESWVSLIHPDDLPEVARKFNNHLESKEEYVAEYRIRCKNNAYKWIRSKGRVSEFGPNGEPIRMIGTNEDITKERLIQQELKERYEQLELLKQEADSANNAKSLFLANMSHEIRTPMNAVISAIQLLSLGALSDEQKRYVDILKNSSENLVAIIDSILDISRLESGKIELHNEPFNLRETINSIFENFLISANTKGLEAGCYIDPDIDHEVIGDELRIRQILTNLLSNAVKFTDNGYISLRARLIESNHEEQKIEFSVKDTGIGIDEDYKPKIFQIFSQGDLSRKKKYMGAGLGLAIAKQLAELMNGDIFFESEVGKGSTFYFTCPLKKERNLTGSEKSISEQIDANNQLEKRKTILCVEDNFLNQEIMESIILKGGYNYLAAYDGNEALEKLREKKVDLILMDIQMPGMNGYELTRIIRDMDNRYKNVPVIAMTAYAMHEDRDKCIQAGMDDYIAKPFDIDQLYAILDSYLGK